ncbi:MAG TPA: CusA/CzcA family heavy metal efflux RND transporter [Candidatus Brocadiia bacterium]|nr:CusA/CzcA family heavy metal efflux RND transporter [Candidatus Brocadiia bacterium]
MILEKLLGFVLRMRLLTALTAILILGAGIAAWKRLPIDAFPDVTNVQVMILAEAPGLAPGEVERLITQPIEIEMGGLPDVTQVRSLSKTGLSQVIVVFTDETDTYFARQLVFERLSQARERLPEGVEPEMGPISTGLGEIYQYVIEGVFHCPEHPSEWSRDPGKCGQCGREFAASAHGLADLRTLQDWLISPQLRRLPGVTEVNSFGGFVKQYHVVPDPALLLKFGISLNDIIEALESNNANAGGGFITRDWEQINVVSSGLLKTISDIETIVLKAEDGTPVYLRDVAEISVGNQTRNGVVTRDGRGEAVIGMVIMLKGANSKIVVERVKAEIPKIQNSLPPGVRIVPFYDRTSLIQACIGTITGALGQGVILVVIVLFLLLWDMRAALTVAVCLPVTVGITFLLMDWRDVTTNLMSLGGLAIAIGMVVDGSIVITENISRHLRDKAESELSRIEVAHIAVNEVARPVVFSTLIIIIVFLPLFTLQSLEGKMFKPLGLTMCFAMAGALIAALTIVPVLASLLVRRASATGGENLLVRIVQRTYAPILALAMRGRWMTAAVAASVMVGAFSLLPKLGTEFLPALDEGAIAINCVRLPTASVEGSALQSSAIEKRLLEKFPEVTTVVSKTGRAEISEDPMGPEQSDLFIMLKPPGEWTDGRTKEQLVEEINAELALFPGIRPSFSQPISLRVNELISGIKSDVAIKISGEDMEVLRGVGERMAPLLASIAGAEDVKIEQVSGFTQLEARVNREAMARHMINARDISDLIETAVGGRIATTIFEGQRRFAVLVRFPQEARSNLESLERLLVPSPLGYDVPLGDVAGIVETDVPAQISREDSRRRLIVECNVRGRDIGGFVAEASAKMAGIEAGLPQGYRIDMGGQFENQQRAMARLMMVVPVALLLIFVMLYVSLGSLRSALLVLVNLPFALVGGIAAIYLLDINLSVSASIGFITLLGIAVENGLILVTFFDQLRKEGRRVNDAVSEACLLRVRPLMGTTLTTLLGLLPMIYATGSGSEIQKPLVAVIFGGLVSSLILTLVILPALYSLVNADRSEQAGADSIPEGGVNSQ